MNRALVIVRRAIAQWESARGTDYNRGGLQALSDIEEEIREAMWASGEDEDE